MPHTRPPPKVNDYASFFSHSTDGKSTTAASGTGHMPSEHVFGRSIPRAIEYLSKKPSFYTNPARPHLRPPTNFAICSRLIAVKVLEGWGRGTVGRTLKDFQSSGSSLLPSDKPGTTKLSPADQREERLEEALRIFQVESEYGEAQPAISVLQDVRKALRSPYTPTEEEENAARGFDNCLCDQSAQTATDLRDEITKDWHSKIDELIAHDHKNTEAKTQV